MADLAGCAEYCKQHATEAIQKHNEHIEVCNRVIEAADSGRPMREGLQEDWRPEMERLRNELAEQVSENGRLSSELAQKTRMVTSLSGRVDELARQMSALGVEYLAGQGEFCPVPIHGSENKPLCTPVLHALGLNEIHLALKETGMFVEWRPESQVRSRNELTSSRHETDCDAVVVVRIGGVEAEFALEYARAPKSKRRYEFVRYKAEHEDQLRRFV